MNLTGLTRSLKRFMANSNPPNMIRLLAFAMLALLLAACSQEQKQQLPPLAEQMAKSYGLDSFGQIEGLRYTWNAEFPGAKKPFDGGAGTIKISRTWEWAPKTNTVSFEGKDMEGKPLKVTYQRSQLSSQSDAVKTLVDPLFFNDQYWLLGSDNDRTWHILHNKYRECNKECDLPSN
ncbi:MAG TPA: hypothetical protein VE961_16475 [Pyrinomonadaceae bacterium]|nr:hypothetical protein [Pyrinomonadaceae bacterium]